MPTRRQAAAAAASVAQASPPFDGCAIALSGKFDAFGHSQSSLEHAVQNLGGRVTRTVTKATTHVVCTEEDYNADTTKVAAGKSRGLPLLSPQWVLDGERHGTKVDEAAHLWTAQSRSSTTANGSTANGKKRPIAATNDQDDSEPDIKKAKGTKTNGNAGDEATQRERQVAEGQFIKDKTFTIPLDDCCPLKAYQVHVESGSGMIWDASLNQSNSGRNNNKFYRLQILHHPASNVYKTWTRWGRVGEAGQNAVLGNGSLQDAQKMFEKKFKDKSGLRWENRGDDPVLNKYAFVERSYNPDSDDESDDGDAKSTKKGGDEDDDDDGYKPPECTLEKPVQDLMTLIFNQQYFQATMSALNYDANKLPLGKLSKATISRGFQQLKDLAALMDRHALAADRWNMTVPDALAHLSNTYYSAIPHAFGRSRPPVIADKTLLKKEIELLESLSDMKDAADIMKIDRKTQDTVHVLDRQFQGLGLKEMTVLDRESNEFTILSKYLNDSRGCTHHISYQVQQIFRIERSGEKDRFDSSPYASIKSDRRLLWHGSRCTNFGGILSQGLRIAPPEAPVSGYMFGKGIYLADMSSKSAGYCCEYISGGHALLLLCEAELGDPMLKLTGASYTAGEDAKMKNMASTWGMGNTGPNKWMDAGVAHESLRGIKMPDMNETPGPTDVQGATLFYNEYICYDVAQVKLRYLFRVKIHD